ncbi:MAG: glutathione S-transferase family protein [Pseudomonadales bacterium]
MKLYESRSPNARRVNLFLAEKGADLPREEVNIQAGENRQPDHRSRNPMGRVPVLELDNGEYLSESVAICRYFEGTHPTPNLFGESAEELAQVEMWNRRAEQNYFLELTGAFRNISGFFKDRETPVPEWGEQCAERALANLAIFDDHLAKHDYLALDRFTIADITFGVALDFTSLVRKLTEKPFPFPTHIQAYQDRLRSRPTWSTQ